MSYDINETMVRLKIEEAERILRNAVLPERFRKGLILALANAKNVRWSIFSRYTWLQREIGKASQVYSE